jgi:hypothetical protein
MGDIHTVYSDGCGTWYPEACSSFPRAQTSIAYTSFLKKASLKELSNTLKIELNILMIIILA